MTTLTEVSSLITELERWLPRARAVHDDGDGLRSPSLEGSVSGGGWSDSVQERLAIANDPRNDRGEAKRNPAGQIGEAERLIARARVELVNAWADAHRRNREED